MQLWFQILVRYALALAAATSVAQGQAAADTAWDPVVRRQVQSIVDSAGLQGLPTAPLTNRVLEAKARHTPPERLIEVLRAHADSMRAARALLSGATPTEIDAGATALRGGVSRAALRRVRDARSAGHGAVAMLVLADLVRRGVSLAEAERAVVTLARRQDDGLLMELQQTFARERDTPTSAALDRIVQKLERRTPSPVRPPESACCAPVPLAPEPRQWLGVAVLPDSIGGRRKSGVHAQASAYVGTVATTQLWMSGETSTGAAASRWRIAAQARRALAESPWRSVAVRAGLGVAAIGAYQSGRGADSLIPPGNGVTPQMEGSAGLVGDWTLPMGLTVRATADVRLWRATQLSYGQVGTRPVILIDSTSGQPVPSGATTPLYGYRQLQSARSSSIASVGLGWHGTTFEVAGGRASALPLIAGTRLSPWVIEWRASQKIAPAAAMVVEYSPTPEPQLWNAGDLGASRFRIGMRLVRAERRSPLVTPSSGGQLQFAYAWTAVADTGAGEVELQVHAANARTVELDGDLTAWRPLAMEMEGPGRFRARVAAPAGIARVRMRVDGGLWFAPPGLPTVTDDAGGVLGVIPGR